MAIPSWLRFLSPVPGTVRSQLTALIERAGIATGPAAQQAEGLGIAVFNLPDDDVLEGLRELTRASDVLAVSLSPSALDTGDDVARARRRSCRLAPLANVARSGR